MPSRRLVLTGILAVPPALLLSRAVGAQDSSLSPTPACGAEAEATAAQTAGPYFLRDAPLKQDFAADAPGGQPIDLAGFVVDRNCAPLPGVRVDLWHADEQGEYDLSGYRLRGHQVTDDAGRWRFATIETRYYSFRTAHYHVRLQAPDGRRLTTQLYFPDDPRNARDSIFDPRLVMTMGEDGGRRVGRFDFVL